MFGRMFVCMHLCMNVNTVNALAFKFCEKFPLIINIKEVKFSIKKKKVYFSKNHLLRAFMKSSHHCWTSILKIGESSLVSTLKRMVTN